MLLGQVLEVLRFLIFHIQVRKFSMVTVFFKKAKNGYGSPILILQQETSDGGLQMRRWWWWMFLL